MSELEVKEVLRKREEETDLENERPCVFKSLSPVRFLMEVYYLA